MSGPAGWRKSPGLRAVGGVGCPSLMPIRETPLPRPWSVIHGRSVRRGVRRLVPMVRFRRMRTAVSAVSSPVRSPRRRPPGALFTGLSTRQFRGLVSALQPGGADLVRKDRPWSRLPTSGCDRHPWPGRDSRIGSMPTRLEGGEGAPAVRDGVGTARGSSHRDANRAETKHRWRESVLRLLPND